MAIEAYGLDQAKIVGVGAGLPAEIAAGKVDGAGSPVEFAKVSRCGRWARQASG